MRGSEVVFSRGKDDWRTPRHLFNKYHRIFKFNVDGAADATSYLTNDFWMGPGSSVPDALSFDWSKLFAGSARVWLNPPYSKVKAFVAKAAEEATRGVLTVALLPSRTDTRWFHDHIYQKPNVRIEFLRGRVKFEDEAGQASNSAPFPSMVVTFFPL